MDHLRPADLLVVALYLIAVVGMGAWFARRRGSSEDFMSAGRALPGWAIGLSMFGSYISSISFLANPGKSYGSNWNAFVFSLAMPVAAALAIWWFVPFYRRRQSVSAYAHFETQFGPWAKNYAVVCFLLMQMSRMAMVLYLLAKATSALTQLPISAIIVAVGAVMTVYTLAGGIKAVVWTGVLQSAVLAAGPIICLAALLLKTPGGLERIISTAAAEHKFSLGSMGPQLTQSTFWVMLAFGLVNNLANFAVDQSYVQRYITAKSNKEAAKSVALTALLYVPVAALFFFIGTALFVFYGTQPVLLPPGMAGDDVFPHFIVTQLPAGMSGLVVAAIFAAAMDSNLNSMATLTYNDLYRPYLRPNASDRHGLRVLYLATVGWGVAIILLALWLIGQKSALDAWWSLVSIFSGGTLGLFALGFMPGGTDRLTAKLAVLASVALVTWMTISPSAFWPSAWSGWKNGLHPNCTLVAAAGVIVLVGGLGSLLRFVTRSVKPA